MTEKNRWLELTRENPDHSAWYIKRFADMAAEGRDLHGEARFMDAMAERNSHILDAGCGPGRVGGELSTLGHNVVGVDLDPILITESKRQFPESSWIAGDLSEVDLSHLAPFDLVISAGNVMTFLAHSTRQSVLENLRRHLAPGGRIVIGFGTERGYQIDDYFNDVAAAGLNVALKLSTWDLRPFNDSSDFLITVLEAQSG